MGHLNHQVNTHVHQHQVSSLKQHDAGERVFMCLLHLFSPGSFFVHCSSDKCLLTTSLVLVIKDELFLLARLAPAVWCWHSGCSRMLAFLSSPVLRILFHWAAWCKRRPAMGSIAFCNFDPQVGPLGLSLCLRSVHCANLTLTVQTACTCIYNCLKVLKAFSVFSVRLQVSR